VTSNDTISLIHKTCLEIAGMLASKSEAYGDSIFNPVRVFSDASIREQILVRIDDKLSRIKRGGNDNEDTLQDLIGYLILLKISEDKQC